MTERNVKPIVISSLEWKILLLFVVGLGFQYFYLRLNLGPLLAFYAFGMFFEFTTEAAWQYNSILYYSTFTVRDRDVNWIYGLGWQATLILALCLGRVLQGQLSWSPWLIDAVGLLIVGNLLEQTFLALGLYRYNRHHWIVTLWTGKPVEILGIPIAVRGGYFVMGVLIHFLAELTKNWGYWT